MRALREAENSPKQNAYLCVNAAQLFAPFEFSQKAVSSRWLHALRVEPVRKRVKRRWVLAKGLQVKQHLMKRRAKRRATC